MPVSSVGVERSSRCPCRGIAGVRATGAVAGAVIVVQEDEPDAQGADEEEGEMLQHPTARCLLRNRLENWDSCDIPASK